MNTTLKRLLGGLALAAALTGGAQANPVTLQSLFNGGSVTIGDKMFDRFSFVAASSSDNRVFDASQIDVTALADNGSGYGVNFEVKDNQFRATGGANASAFASYSFGFRVTATDPAQRMVGAWLGFEPSFSSLFWQSDQDNDLGMTIAELIGTAPGNGDLANDLSIEFSVLNEDVTRDFPDQVSFGAVSELWVTKNIRVWSRDADDSAHLAGFSQRFSQTQIPEPTSLLLVTLALAGLVVTRRRD